MEVVLGLIIVGDKILSVSRKNDHNDLGFPGGKIDLGETPEEALIRELKEETGLTVIKYELIDEREDYHGANVKMYFINEYSGEISTNESGLVSWVTPNELCSLDCSFAEYNLEFFEHLFSDVDSITKFNNIESKKSTTEHVVITASKATDIETFMKLLCPVQWYPIIARIIESGVKFDPGNCKWLIGWSDIPNTKKIGVDELDSALKTCMFKMHDCFHQLWGIPLPSPEFTEEDFYITKRAQMCGEVSVLTMTEFMFAKHLWDTYPELRQYLENRNSLKMYHGVLKDKTPVQIAMRLDEILHKNRRPKWLRDDEASVAFADDYVPMLQRDRDNIDHNWKIMKEAKWIPLNAPNIRYSPNMDGLELTIWMIEDFYHMLKTDDKIDYPLAEFNHNRRQAIEIPNGWWH